VEGQPLLCAPDQVMQMAAHGPDELGGLREADDLVALEDAHLDKIPGSAGAVEIARDPVQRLQVAQPALRLLDVRLEQVARAAVPLVPRVALGHLGLDELRAGLEEQLAPETLVELLRRLRVAG